MMNNDESLPQRISDFFNAMGKAGEQSKICLLKFDFKGVGEDLEATFIDMVTNEYHDILMNPESKEII